MSRCETIRKKKRRVCIGDMQDVISIQNRDITPPLFNTVDFDEDFTEIPTLPAEQLALVETVTGKTYFDGVAETDVPITHKIYITYSDLVTAECWVIFEGRRIDILAVEDLDERHEFMLLTCNDEGLVTKEASKA